MFNQYQAQGLSPSPSKRQVRCPRCGRDQHRASGLLLNSAAVVARLAELSLTQADLARRIGEWPQPIGQMLQRRRFISDCVAAGIADVLGLPVEQVASK